MKSFISKVLCFSFICIVICGLGASAKAVPSLSFDVSNSAPVIGDTITR